MPAGQDVWESLGLVIAIVTLPIGLLSAMFASLQAAAVVFVVGWFLLTPLLLVFGDEVLPVIETARGEQRESATPDVGATDPRDELKRRYVRGEIDDEEFERRMQKVIEADHDGDVADWTSDAETEDDESTLDVRSDERDRERSVE